MKPDDLIEDTRARLAAYRGQIPRIAELAGVSYSWASKFSQGKVDNPTIRQLAAITEALDRLDTAQ